MSKKVEKRLTDLAEAKPGEWFLSRRTGHVWRYAWTRVDHPAMGEPKLIWEQFWPSTSCSRTSSWSALDPEEADLVRLPTPTDGIGWDFDYEAWAESQ